MHGYVFAPEAPQPSLDTPGNLNIVDAGIVAEFPLVHQGRHMQVRTACQVLQAVAQDGERTSFPEVHGRYYYISWNRLIHCFMIVSLSQREAFFLAVIPICILNSLF